METILKKKPIVEGINAEVIGNKFDLKNYSGADINAFIETATREAAWGAH